MIKKRKLINNYIDKQSKVCDRCGNDISQGGFMIHLPFRKKYVVLCSICQFGLIFAYHKDFVNDQKGGGDK
jgi:ribosomal protein S27AE